MPVTGFSMHYKSKMKKVRSAFLIIVSLFIAGCSTNVPPPAGEVQIRFGEMKQEIDGFGGSDAWLSLPRDADTAAKVVRLLYSKTDGAGFTILRNRIPFRERLSGDDHPELNDGFVVRKDDNTYDYTESGGVKTFNLNWNNWDLGGTRNLIARIKSLGADGPEHLVIMSTPWTPPNNRVTQWKENVVGVNSKLDSAIDWSRPDWWGRLKKDKYNDYADLLADYARDFAEKMGAPLAVLSVQNEPNWKVQYESAYWSGTDIRDFLRVLGQRFPAKSVTLGENGLGIMAPEYENFNINFDEMIQPSLDDPGARNVLTHVGLHQYNGAWDTSGKGGAKAFPPIAEAGKRFWQTEVSGSGPQLPKGRGMDNALYYAKMIHHDMTLAQINAFLFWWMWGNDSDTDGTLIAIDGDTVTPALRLYAMGQYSRFIRPGWRRIEATPSPAYGIYASAYRNPQSDEIAVVMINDTNITITITVSLEDAAFRSLKAWRTSAKEKLGSQGTQSLSRGAADVTLPPKSITTYYGQITK
jgi:O-glycosyl hydrolase